MLNKKHEKEKRMKNNNKKNLRKYSARSNISLKAKRERGRRELLRLAEECGVETRGAKIKFGENLGRGGKRARGRQDEIKMTGIYSESSSGYGFVACEDYSRGDVFIPRSATAGALGGDLVEVVFHEYTDSSGKLRTEGRITKIIKESGDGIIGTLKEELCYNRGSLRKLYILLPDDGKIKRQIIVTKTNGAAVNDKVLVYINRDSMRSDSVHAEVMDIFGSADSREGNYMAILAECGINTEFSEEEKREAAAVCAVPISYEGRVRRREVIFTIDGAGAKDLDDAISLSRIKDGWVLGVHIADVSSYVKEKTALDRLATARGCSVYFTDKVVPMLPEELSNGVCSLNPGEDKYTLSAIITLSDEGEIKSLKIEPSIIRSRVKGIYSEVNSIFEKTAEEDILEKYKECLPSLRRMHKLYLILKKRAAERGELELDSTEAYIKLDDSGEPVEIIKCTRGDAEKMIEQFMLLANEAVATALTDAGIPCVYRVHERPPEEKLEALISYLANLGFDTRPISSENADAKAFSAIIDEAKERGISEPVSYAMLRAMSKAMYSEIHRKHFGLGISNYCHFTSPIRRLSDLATHRIIHRVLLEGKPAERYRSYAKRAAAAATEGEMRAVNAERRIEALYKVLFMQKHIGEEFSAKISGISDFGFFAMLENTCEGLVPLSTLSGMFIYDEKNITLRQGQNILRLGDEVKVRLEEADVARGKLRFSLVCNNTDED